MNSNVPNKVKQISYLSAIIVIIGATIGAGIFVKNGSLLSLTQGRIPFVIATWTVAGFALISLGVALIEVASVASTNKGFLEWTRAFTHKWIHKGSVGYMIFFYYPVNIFALSCYLVQEANSISNYHMSGLLVGFIAFLIAMWTCTITGFSLFLGERIQWVATFGKFLPLFVLPFIAYIKHDGPATIDPNSYANGFAGASPWVGLIATIPSIAFAFDGFYQASNIKENMKKPEKAPRAMIVAIGIIVILYFFFSSSFLFATKTGQYGDLNIGVWISVFRVLICVSIFGIVNGYAIVMPNLVQALWQDDEVWQPKFLKRFKKDRVGATIFTLILTTVFFAVLVPMGVFTYKANAGYVSSFGESAAGLYALVDIFASWSSMVIFMLIGLTILGCLINRRTKKIGVKKYKHFVWTGIIGFVYIAIGFFYMLIEQIVNMFGYNGADQQTAIVTFIILIASLFLGYIPFAIKEVHNKFWPKKNNVILRQENN